jgi:hypothetical protein
VCWHVVLTCSKSSTVIHRKAGDHSQVTRMTGRGEVLVMIPENGTFIEGWTTNRFDGSNAGPLWTPEWLLHTKAVQVQGSNPCWDCEADSENYFGFSLLYCLSLTDVHLTPINSLVLPCQKWCCFLVLLYPLWCSLIVFLYHKRSSFIVLLHQTRCPGPLF